MPSRKRKSESREHQQGQQAPSREHEKEQQGQEFKNVPENQTPNTPEKKESKED
ncbi:MAG: hypothetical protein ACJ8J7_01365 [Sulfurifustaceae bacterium]